MFASFPNQFETMQLFVFSICAEYKGEVHWLTRIYSLNLDYNLRSLKTKRDDNCTFIYTADTDK